jgi:hypothetical protein
VHGPRLNERLAHIPLPLPFHLNKIHQQKEITDNNKWCSLGRGCTISKKPLFYGAPIIFRLY